jgi:hypothetical protein
LDSTISLRRYLALLRSFAPDAVARLSCPEQSEGLEAGIFSLNHLNPRL